MSLGANERPWTESQWAVKGGVWAGDGPRGADLPLSIDPKARAEAAFRGQTTAADTSPVEQAAEAAQAKIARLKALREARDKAVADRTDVAREKARRARDAKQKP